MVEKVMRNRKLPTGVKLGYGSTGFAAIMTLSIFIMYGMFFLTDVVGLDPAFAGIILSIGTLWDAITDPLIGSLSDKRDPKKGRRRPFLKWVAIPFGVVAWLLFTNPGLSQTANKIYFILVAIAFYTVQTILDVPYTALGAEMTLDYDERSSLNGNRNFFATISGVISAFTMTFVAFFSDKFGSASAGWSATAAGYAIIATITIYIGYKSTEGYELTKVDNEDKASGIEFLKDVLKNKVFLYTAGLFAFSLISLTIQNSAMLYYLIYYMGFTSNQVSTALLIAWVPGLLWVPIINAISQKWSKKVAWITCMSIWAVGVFVIPMFILKPDSKFYLVGILQLCSGVGIVSQYQIVWSMIPDIIEVDEFKTGKRREGGYYGIIAFIQKGLTALTMLVSGTILTKIGYVPNAEQSVKTLNGMKLLIAIGGAVFLVISILIAYFNPINRERHAALTKAINDRRAGDDYSTDGFKELL
ncbi:glycoside-pentoside-hexuronide (GPH):cation symporter [Clostridiaceae bacterium M8S5]|nr:glycoside-pentoside-hexuronide (GPH):cation symporter [Clostridiaceae bacterium M8S5]